MSPLRHALNAQTPSHARWTRPAAISCVSSRDGSLKHTLSDEDGRPRAERIEFLGEPVVLLWYRHDSGEAVGDAWRFEVVDGRLSSMRSYYFCPELLEEIAAETGVPVWTNGRLYN